jgi:predicted ferric reductase
LAAAAAVVPTTPNNQAKKLRPTLDLVDEEDMYLEAIEHADSKAWKEQIGGGIPPPEQQNSSGDVGPEVEQKKIDPFSPRAVGRQFETVAHATDASVDAIWSQGTHTTPSISVSTTSPSCPLSPSSCLSFETDGSSSTESPKSVKYLFKKASEYLHPGPMFRATVYLYAERKLVVFFFIHFMATMTIWLHFALIKFEQQKDSVPDGAAYYWWKRLLPPLEFGSMHAILFQMALIPLTMSRYTIQALSGSVIDRFVPLSRTLRMHIHLGYTTVLIVFLATVFFFAFFGLLCSGGEQAFCDKFTSEIMITGYCILGLLLIIGVTSHFRHSIPYEVFYAIHHLVFILYVLTIVHTFDKQQREGNQDRSQTFKWFSIPLLYYVCDRAAMHINHKYRTRILSSSALIASNGAKMIILKLRRPALFQFKPGQYAYLRLPKIDTHWHPFSIASDPGSSELQFYVEVFGATSWTGRLWDMLELDEAGGVSHRQIEMDIMGPVGTHLAKTEEYSHALAIGTGTGIVPVLSLYKQQVRQLLRLSPTTHFHELTTHQEKIREVAKEEKVREGSVAQHLTGTCRRRGKYVQLQESKADYVKESIRCHSMSRHSQKDAMNEQDLRNTTKMMKKAAFKATQNIYGIVLLAFLAVFGVALIGLTISWNTIPIDLYGGMVTFLKWFTVVFQACFAFVAFFVWDANQFLAYIDVGLTLLAPFANWYWVRQCEDNGRLNAAEITLYCLLNGYMVYRVWSMAVMPPHRSWRAHAEDDGVRTMERLDVVWVCRSASMVSEIFPDVNETWKSLVDAWGEKNAQSVCRVSIYVTDKNKEARDLLIKELRDTPLYKCGSIHFGRPDFPKLIQEHTIELISTRHQSRSLLAYVGSPQLASQVHHYKISNDMVTAITGNNKHQMYFVSESYGGFKPKAKVEQPEDQTNEDDDSWPFDGLSVRRTTSYDENASHAV